MIRIIIVDDHAILRAGIRALLRFYDDMEVVAEAENAAQAIQEVARHQPDVVLMDIGLIGVDGLTATREIISRFPKVRVLILTQHENREYVIPAIKIGAAGYVLKRAPDDTLIRAIHAVHEGNTYLDPAIGPIIMEEMRRSPDGQTDPFESLTERERQILILLAQGKTYQEVGESLFISPKTVDFHRTNLMRKLGLENRAALTRFALERSLI
jgi:DNA-binding NarL/FixJ family response regulator